MHALDWRGKLSRLLLREVTIESSEQMVCLTAKDVAGLVTTEWRGIMSDDISQMKTWDISHNQLTDAGLLYVIQQTNNVTSTNIKRINLSYNYISNAVLPELRVWLDQFPNAMVDLRYNAMTEEDVNGVPDLRRRSIIQGFVEAQLVIIDQKVDKHTTVMSEKMQKYTQENMARILEESIIPFISNYLDEKGLLHVMVLNKDPDYKLRRELHAPSKPSDFVREYDGLFVVKVNSESFLLNNESQLHLTKNKLDRIVKSLAPLI